MICKNCGAENDNDALYCEKCGEVLKSVTNSRTTLVIVIIATILIIIGLNPELFLIFE